MILIRVLFGRKPRPQGAWPQLQKIGIFEGINLQIFGAQGAENFKNSSYLIENWLFFGVLSENLATFRQYSDFGLIWVQK